MKELESIFTGPDDYKNAYLIVANMLMPFVQEFGHTEGFMGTLERLLVEINQTRRVLADLHERPCPVCGAELLIQGDLEDQGC